MHGILRIALLGIGAATTLASAQQPSSPITEEGLRAHLRFLSHDLLEGRAPGTRGGELAAEYIATRFQAAGLRPVEGAYFQAVPLVGVTVQPDATHLFFEGDADSAGAAADRLEAAQPTEAVVWPGPARPTVEVDGELVFVGYGIAAPEWEWDDYKGLDVAGRVVLILVGDPPAPPEEPGLFDGRRLTYYGRWSYKLEEARRRGAAGALLVHRTDAAGYGWDVVASSWTGEQFMLPEDGAEPPLLLNGWVSESLARRVLATSGHDLDALHVRAARRDFRPVRTGTAVRARIVSESRRLRTRNVVGRLPGSEPDRADDVVAFTAHYDHLGIGAPDADGDSIYNGAYDNASGVAVLLELAAAFAALEGGTSRGLLFIATAAEEAGMLGSRYYVSRPLVPLSRTVAAFNIDGANLWGETDDLIAIGAGESSLGSVLQARASALGLTVRPDPAPAAGSFFRSDHFPFAQAGVPVLYLEHGLQYRGRPEGWGAEQLDRYIRERYHQPGDEYAPDLDLGGAIQQADVLFRTGLDVATAERAPEWNEGSPYRAARERSRRGGRSASPRRR